MERDIKNVFEIFPVLKERENQIAHTLSGEEQQMLAIGRALMTRPILILLDEISLGLAPIVVAKIYDALKELNDKGGVSMVIVEQCITKVAEIADNIIIQERKSGRLRKTQELNVERIKGKITSAYELLTVRFEDFIPSIDLVTLGFLTQAFHAVLSTWTSSRESRPLREEQSTVRAEDKGLAFYIRLLA